MKKLKKIPLKKFDYILPANLISQAPIKPRDHARLLILEKKLGKIEHKKFYNIEEYLNPGDVLVLNNSKVIPGSAFRSQRNWWSNRNFSSNKTFSIYLANHD